MGQLSLTVSTKYPILTRESLTGDKTMLEPQRMINKILMTSTTYFLLWHFNAWGAQDSRYIRIPWREPSNRFD